VSDEGHGLPDTLKYLQHIFAPLQYPLSSSCVLQEAGLLLRTTHLEEKTIRRYQISTTSYSTSQQQALRSKLNIDKSPLEEEKLPGMQISGTQVTIFSSSLLVQPEAALAACQHLLSMLSTLCPPVRLVFKVQDLQLVDGYSEDVHVVVQSSQQEMPPGSVATTTTAPPPTTTTSFARQLDPLPSTSLLTPMQRLKTGLLEEFPSSTPPSQPSELALLSYVGVGEGAIPRGCKWTAIAGVALQIPDHRNTLSVVQQQQSQQSQYQSSHEENDPQQQQQQPGAPNSSDSDVVSTPAYVFKSYAVQFTENSNYLDALRRVNWTGNGFKLILSSAASIPVSSTTTVKDLSEQQQASLEPVSLVLKCEQPESLAHIAAIVVHLYPINSITTAADSIDTTPGSEQQNLTPTQSAQQKSKNAVPPPLLKQVAPLHQRTLIRTAIDAALADLKLQCPSIISDRRDRSLMKALPVVSTAVAGILNRAVGDGVLVEACLALRAREVGELEETLHRKLEEVVISQQQQQQQRGEGAA
jgi:hypothetical protein